MEMRRQQQSAASSHGLDRRRRRRLFACCAALLFVGPASVSAVVFRDCWLLFGTLDDIGYTHSMNLGRLQINRYLSDTYKEHSFESIAYPGVFFMDEEPRARLVNQTIADGCDLIFSSSAGLMDEVAYALEFPNISFVRGSGAHLTGNLPPNLVENSFDWFKAAFVMGAVAGAVSETCAGFINAFEHRRSTWAHAMGFTLGYQRSKPLQPVYIVTMDNYFNPEAEVLAARQLIEQKDCDVIVHHTDPNDVDKYVYELGNSNNNRRRVLSTARYVDMSTFVGDTVFTSQVWNGFEIMRRRLFDLVGRPSGKLYQYHRRSG
jgi:basic membrane lipoprotein Med (substrate-binding protein (PBP1-ABC) superfamily)